jgi:hypothetical protein
MTLHHFAKFIFLSLRTPTTILFFSTQLLLIHLYIHPVSPKKLVHFSLVPLPQVSCLSITNFLKPFFIISKKKPLNHQWLWPEEVLLEVGLVEEEQVAKYHPLEYLQRWLLDMPPWSS